MSVPRVRVMINNRLFDNKLCLLNKQKRRLHAVHTNLMYANQVDIIIVIVITNLRLQQRRNRAQQRRRRQIPVHVVVVVVLSRFAVETLGLLLAAARCLGGLRRDIDGWEERVEGNGAKRWGRRNVWV